MSQFKKLLHILNISVFFGFAVIFALATVLIPKNSYSENENRYLADMPTLSAKTWFSGDYIQDLTDWLDDRFTFRSNWISLHTELELLQGKNEVNGVYITSDRLLELTNEINYSRVDSSIDAIEYFSSLSDTNVYFMLVPTSAEIYSDEVAYIQKKVSQRELINYCYNRLREESEVSTIDVYSSLYSERDEYIYYRTDHHWTPRGAYIAYTAAAQTMGYSASGMDRFDISYASYNFLGSLHSKILFESVEADTIELFISNARTVTKYTLRSDGSLEQGSVFETDYLSGKDKYLCYLGENTALTKLVSDSSGGKLLVIKDSYANCFLPYLSENYSEIDIIDLRYLTDISMYIDIGGLDEYDGILILYNAQNFAEDTNLVKLKLAKK